MSAKLIVIVTPTFNRSENLKKLYASLKSQESYNFKWMIIDDGSEDQTKVIVENFVEQANFTVEYYYQNNGGKGRALNNAFKRVEVEELVLIVDSDDYLLPRATKIIESYYKSYQQEKNIGAFLFYYQHENGKVLQHAKHTPIINDIVMSRQKFNIEYGKNDGCICYFRDAINKYHYPEYDNEKYSAPTIIQMSMFPEYTMLFSPTVVGVAEYLPNGLTNSGRKLRLQNPKNMLHYEKLVIQDASFLVKAKQCTLMWVNYRLLGQSFLDVLKVERSHVVYMLLAYLPSIVIEFSYKLKKYL